MQELKPGTLLQGGKYKILRKLGQGGFGITYLAFHDMLDCNVAIKEFFFKEYCDRDADTSHVTLGTESNRNIVDRFQQKFLKEAKTIFKLHHPNIIQIHDIFTENNTAYYVMEYIDGESLGEIVKRNGAFSEQKAISYIEKVGDALSYIHSQNINHLDVKPGNIMLRKSDGQVILIDFGVAKQYDAVTQEGTTTTPVGISHGYSPLEQYRSNGVQEFSPQSDVYALAATLFKLLTGITPPEAIEVQEEGLPVEELKANNVSQNTIDAIESAMQSRKKRTQSIAEFLSSISNNSTQTLSGSSSLNEETQIIGTVKNELSDETILAQPNSDELHDIRVSDTIRKFRVNGINFNMIKVEGGTFEMKENVSSGFLNMSSKEIVQKTTLSDYWIGETLVTQALWKVVMGSTPSEFKQNSMPVAQVSWNDSQDFIKKLNSILYNKCKFRLPTEAEWEFASRGGNQSGGYIYSGSNNIDDVAWYEGNSGKKIHIVGQKQPNELGIHDMSGNLWEWCDNLYTNYNSNSYNSYERVLRGGCCSSNKACCTSFIRACKDPNEHLLSIGFRLALSE